MALPPKRTSKKTTPKTQEKTSPEIHSGQTKKFDNELKRVEMAVQYVKRTIYSGPVPSPQMLTDYEKILPGSANRLVSLAEDELKLHHAQEKNNTRRIRSSALVLLSFAVVAIFAIWMGYPITGTIIISFAPLSTLFRVLLENKSKNPE